MKIIDFHTHIFPDSLATRAIEKLKALSDKAESFTNGTAAGLETSMKCAGIDRAVLLPVATKVSQVHSINEGCASLTNDRFIPFGALHPDTPDFIDEIAFLKDQHVKGIKLHPEYQNFYVDAPSMFPIYDALADAGLITVFHAGKDPGPFSNDHALPAALKHISLEFPKLKIVAAHLGGWNVWDDVERTLCGLPIWFDTAAVMDEMDRAAFIRIIKKHGTERILFGSDSPWFDQSALIQWIDLLDLTATEKEAVFFRNATALLDVQTRS